MILSHAQIEEIAAATTKDFNRFFFKEDEQTARSTPRGTPIDQLASQYLGLKVSFTRLSRDGSLCGVTAYSDTEYIFETDGMTRTIPLKRNQVLFLNNSESEKHMTDEDIKKSIEEKSGFIGFKLHRPGTNQKALRKAEVYFGS